MLTAEEELARLQAQKKESWLSRFRKDRSTPATPEESRRPSQAASEGAGGDAQRQSTEMPKQYTPYDADVEERLETGKTAMATEKAEGEAVPDVQVSESPTESPKSLDKREEKLEQPESTKEAIVEPPISKDTGVGFDLEKIRETIAEDDGSGQLPVAAPAVPTGGYTGQRQSADEPRSSISTNVAKGKTSLFGRLRSKPDLNRTGSAPVPKASPTLPNGKSAEQLQYEAQQRMLEEQEKREEEAFRKGLPVDQLYPATDNPFASSSASLPSFDTEAPSANAYGFANANGHSTGLSFGGADGSISFASDDRQTPAWQSSSTDTSNAWKDPWQTGSGNAWSSSSRW